MAAQAPIMEVREVETMDGGTLALLNRSEIEQQVATAKRYRRNVHDFLTECKQMATLNEAIAQGCIYALPRGGKTIEGPSARLAEIVASAWGNCRAGARQVHEDEEFVTAQGVFLDLEKNVAITMEVRRRIVDKSGKRYSSDVINQTANAACSIALRNAVLKGVPKAFWNEIYEEVRKVVMGDSKTLATRRADAIAYLQKFGVSQEQILAKFSVKGIEDITLDHLAILRGVATAIKEGDTTAEEAFAIEGAVEIGKDSPLKKNGNGGAPAAMPTTAAPPPAPAAAEPQAAELPLLTDQHPPNPFGPTGGFSNTPAASGPRRMVGKLEYRIQGDITLLTFDGAKTLELLRERIETLGGSYKAKFKQWTLPSVNVADLVASADKLDVDTEELQ